jgi:hypothetical protein
VYSEIFSSFSIRSSELPAGVFGRPTAGPAGTIENRAKILRVAFAGALNDFELKVDVQKGKHELEPENDEKQEKLAKKSWSGLRRSSTG